MTDVTRDVNFDDVIVKMVLVAFRTVQCVRRGRRNRLDWLGA